MTNIKFYAVTVDRFDYRVISQLSPSEQEKVFCYSVNPSKPKLIYQKANIINEWQLKWYDSRYQTLKYYEYGLYPHLFKNDELTKDLTHVCALHYDARFPKNSINDLIIELDNESNVIYYNTIRQNDVLYFTKEQLKYICEYLSIKLNMSIDSNKIWDEGFICESFIAAPTEIFLKFGKFMLDNQYDFENMVNTNRWGIMNTAKHRLCGLVERFLGFYLMSCNLPLKKLNVEHERDLYVHAHLSEK